MRTVRHCLDYPRALLTAIRAAGRPWPRRRRGWFRVAVHGKDFTGWKGA